VRREILMRILTRLLFVFSGGVVYDDEFDTSGPTVQAGERAFDGSEQAML
jgi:hypothetical protein